VKAQYTKHVKLVLLKARKRDLVCPNAEQGTRVDAPVPAPIADHLATSSFTVKFGSYLVASVLLSDGN